MTPQVFDSDIPLEVARAAHSRSRGSEAAARSELERYSATLAADFAEIGELAKEQDPDVQRDIDRALDDYRTGYRVRVIAFLISQAGRAVVAGSTRYPAPRIAEPSRLRAEEITTYRELKLAEIRRLAAGTSAAYDVGPLDRLRVELSRSREEFTRMKAANAVLREHAESDRATQLTVLSRLGVPEHEAHRILIKDHLERVGYPELRLKNKYSEIARLRARVEAAELVAQRGDVVIDGDRGRVHIADSEVKLQLSGRADKVARQDLAAAGFTYRGGVWRSAWNTQAVDVARRIAGAGA